MDWNEIFKNLLREQLRLADRIVGMLPDPVRTDLRKAGKDILSAVGEVAGEFAGVEKAEKKRGDIHKVDIE